MSEMIHEEFGRQSLDDQYFEPPYVEDDSWEPEPGPTWSKECECGATVERWRGDTDVSCRCGAWYNSSGQRLRDDWMGNRSNYDDDVSDMDGFEQQHAGDS